MGRLPGEAHGVPLDAEGAEHDAEGKAEALEHRSLLDVKLQVGGGSFELPPGPHCAIEIDADRYTPVDKGLIPTGVLASVEDTPFDFRTATAIGARIGADDPQIAVGGGYDHNVVFTAGGNEGTRVRVHDPASGRTLSMVTTQPGVQFYTGNFLDGTITGKGGHVYKQRAGFCLETQHCPDSPNQSNFPSSVLKPGEEYKTSTVFTFGISR